MPVYNLDQEWLLKSVSFMCRVNKITESNSEPFQEQWAPAHTLLDRTRQLTNNQSPYFLPKNPRLRINSLHQKESTEVHQKLSQLHRWENLKTDTNLGVHFSSLASPHKNEIP